MGSDRGTVAIYKGVQQSIGPIALSDVYEDSDISVRSLPEYTARNVRSTINATSLDDAREIVDRLRKAAETGQDQASGTGGDGASPSPTSTASPTPTASPTRGSGG